MDDLTRALDATDDFIHALIQVETFIKKAINIFEKNAERKISVTDDFPLLT